MPWRVGGPKGSVFFVNWYQYMQQQDLAAGIEDGKVL
jgi:Tfp pilus assembly protein PilW